MRYTIILIQTQRKEHLINKEKIKSYFKLGSNILSHRTEKERVKYSVSRPMFT